MASNLSDADLDLEIQIAEQEAALAQEQASPEQSSNMLEKGLMALDIQGGPTRSAVYGGLGALLGKDVARKDELVNAALLQKGFPGSDTYLERLGVPEKEITLNKLAAAIPSMIFGPAGGALAEKSLEDSLGGVSVPLRASAGLASDIFLDPSTYESGGASALARAGKFIKELPAVAPKLEAAGKFLQKQAFLKPFQKAERFGKEGFIDAIQKEKIYGTPTMVYEKVDNTINKLSDKASNLIKKAEDLGATPDPRKALQPYYDKIEDFRARQLIGDDQAAALIREAENKYTSRLVWDPTSATYVTKKSPLSVFQGWKSQAQSGLPNSAWDQLRVSNMDVAETLEKARQYGFRKEIENATSKVSKDIGKDLAETNSRLGDFLTTKDRFIQAHEQAQRKLLPGSSDVAMGALGSLTNQGGAKYLAAKKALEIGGGTAALSTLGYGLRKVGESTPSPWLDTLMRQGLIRTQRPEEQ